MHGSANEQIIVLFDKDEEVINAYKAIFRDYQPPIPGLKISCVRSDVVDLVKKYKIDALVSPSNSFGFMDGGIDETYTHMFQNIQDKVQERIRAFGIKTKLDRNFLPVGSAFLLDTGSSPEDFSKYCDLIVCPTMFFPEPITGTENVFYSFCALLQLIQLHPGKIIACPSLGTGVGKMDPNYAAQEVMRAVENFQKVSQEYNYQQKILYRDTSNFVLKEFACQQLDTYANREIQ